MHKIFLTSSLGTQQSL